MKTHLLLITALVLFPAPTAVWAHGGGLDKYGCHHNRKQGGYHCHRGSFAGQSFASKEEMLKQTQSDSPRNVEKGAGKKK